MNEWLEGFGGVFCFVFFVFKIYLCTGGREGQRQGGNPEADNPLGLNFRTETARTQAEIKSRLLNRLSGRGF